VTCSSARASVSAAHVDHQAVHRGQQDGREDQCSAFDGSPKVAARSARVVVSIERWLRLCSRNAVPTSGAGLPGGMQRRGATLLEGWVLAGGQVGFLHALERDATVVS